MYSVSLPPTFITSVVVYRRYAFRSLIKIENLLFLFGPLVALWQECNSKTPVLQRGVMTKFYVNEREIAPPLDVSSLDNVLKQIEQDHLPPNSVVRHIQIDGIPLMREDTPENSSELLQSVQTREKIEIYTGTLVEIARDSISEALDYLNRIEAATPFLATGFQTYPGPESFEGLRQLYEGLYWLVLLMDKLETGLRIGLQNILINNVPAKEHHQKFIGVLKQMIDSQEKGDFILIADLLEYEILPFVPIWREMFTVIMKKVEGEP